MTEVITHENLLNLGVGDKLCVTVHRKVALYSAQDGHQIPLFPQSTGDRGANQYKANVRLVNAPRSSTPTLWIVIDAIGIHEDIGKALRAWESDVRAEAVTVKKVAA